MSTKSEELTFRVATYNILSSSLDDARSHYKCDPYDLDSDRRLKRIQEMLKSEMEASSIICLQEVSLKWTGELYVWFNKKNYTMVTSNYGGRFSGYMGVAIAWPSNTYSIEELRIDTIADTIRLLKTSSSNQDILPQKFSFQNMLRRIFPFSFLKNIELDPWVEASRRNNKMIFARLRHLQDSSSSKQFCVATYHMPCAFRVPPLMTIHSSLAIQHVQRLAKSFPFVVAGDFNIKPDSSQYMHLTTGKLDQRDEAYPITYDNNYNSVALKNPIKSAYAEVLGAEPEFTNWSCIGDNGDFWGCLDYIFYSSDGKLRPFDVLKLKNKESCKGPLPTATEPSDHILLSAKFQIQQ